MLIVDAAAVAALLFAAQKVFNSKLGWRYLLIIAGALVLLIASSYLALPALRLSVQAIIIVLIVSVPVLFGGQLTALISGEAKTTPPTLNIFTQLSISILGAAILVMLGHGLNTQVGQFPVAIPIQAVNLADGLSASVASNQTATIFIEAPRSTWNGLTASSFSATVDTAKQGQGTYTLPIAVTSKVASARVLSVTPATVALTIEPIVKKTVSVVVKYTGHAGNGLVPDSPQLTPSKVDITGAQSVLSTITQVIAPVTLNGETTAIEQTVTGEVLDPSGNPISNVTITPATIDVKVNVITPGLSKTVGIVPIITGVPGSGYWVQTIATSPSVVTVTGTPDALAALTQLTTSAISVSGITSNTTLKTTLVIPAGITLLDNSNQTVSVVVGLGQTATTKTITPSLVYAGIPDGLQVASISPASISAIVSGLSTVLNGLADGSVSIKIDLSAYKSAGTYSVTITNASFVLPNGVSLVSFLPSAISVTLSSK